MMLISAKTTNRVYYGIGTAMSVAVVGLSLVILGYNVIFGTATGLLGLGFLVANLYRLVRS